MSVIEQPVAIPSGTWGADMAHSSVEFEIRHLGLVTIHGRAGVVTASLDTTGAQPELEGAIETASLTTFDPGRDQHLAAPDFFDAERYPEIRFESTAFEVDSSGAARVRGDLTIKGVTRSVELTGAVNGSAVDPWGNTRVGVDLEGTIDRTEFGVQWNAPLPTGGFLLSDDVLLSASFSFVKEA